VRFVNRHSLLMVGAGALGLLALATWSAGLGIWVIPLALAAALGLAFAFSRLGPGRSTHRDVQAVLDQIGRGLPVLLLFQSAY
jgi:hypothetical protein